MESKSLIKWTSLVIFLSLIGSAFLVIRVNAQDQTIDDLRTHLTAKGVPIRSIITAKRIPFVIKIALQSKSNDKTMQPDDLYYAQIARKAATLFYRHGQRINGYELEIVNTNGEVISWESNNILPGEISQQNLSIVPSKLNDQDTANLIRSEMDFHGLSLDKIDVSSDQDLGDAGQELILQLSTQDINTANHDLIPFLLSVHDFLDKINSTNGTRITICWIKVFDKQHNQILNYVWDIETREETSIQAPGLAAWYPVPAPVATNAPTSPVNTVPTQSIPPGSGATSYPPPKPTANTPPYP